MGNIINKKILILILILAGILVVFLTLNIFSKQPAPSSQQPTPFPVIPAPILPTASPTPADIGKGFESEEYKRAEQKFIDEHPLLQKLPAKSEYFSIEYIDEQHLVVHSKTENKTRDYESVKDWFKVLGVDLNKIAVEYK